MKSIYATLAILTLTTTASFASDLAAQAPPKLPKIVISHVRDHARILIPAKPVLAADARPEVSAPTPAKVSSEVVPVINWDAPPIADIKQLLIDDGIEAVTAQSYEDLIMKTAKSSGVPADVLFAAIYQESDYQHLGINLDYGNYSCGISQYNISGWCQTINHSAKLRRAFGWPEGVKCDTFETGNQKIMSPFLTAIQSARTIDGAGTNPQDFLNLDATPSREQMIEKMPGATATEKEKLYQAALSFGTNCSDPKMGIVSMAVSLKEIYKDYLPKELKASHPHTAWVVADAIYNIGPVLIDIIRQHSGPFVWQTLTPQNVIDLEGAIWAQRPVGATDTTTFSLVDSDGEKQDVKYFQTCVNQRHITHIIRAALPYGDEAAIHPVTEDCGDL